MTEENQKKSRNFRVNRIPAPLTSEDSRLQKLVAVAKSQKPEEGGSNTEGFIGIQEHPICMAMALELSKLNPYHEKCLETKTDSIVGQGLRAEDAYDVLDPVCKRDFDHLTNKVDQDVRMYGFGFIEVVRDEDNENLITGLYHIPAAQLKVSQEDYQGRNWHYVFYGNKTVVMAEFGDLADLKKRTGLKRGRGRPKKDENTVTLEGEIINSEVIMIAEPSACSEWYGGIDYTSAVPYIELANFMVQYEGDFYFNHGIPDFIVELVGANLDSDCITTFKAMLTGSTGQGNGHRTGVSHFNSHPDEVRMVIHKLVSEIMTEGAFGEKMEKLMEAIVSVHGVPAILAGLLVPGKMGSNNEGPNALILFQKTKCGPAQRVWSKSLQCTLGQSGLKFSSPDDPNGKALPANTFKGIDRSDEFPFAEKGNAFKTIVDHLDMVAMDTMAKQREPQGGSTRNPKDGLLSSGNERTGGRKTNSGNPGN